MADETPKVAEPAAAVVTERVVTREVKEPVNGPGMATDPPKPEAHCYRVPDGEGGFRNINAWGEEKGSPEDKKRW